MEYFTRDELDATDRELRGQLVEVTLRDGRLVVGHIAPFRHHGEVGLMCSYGGMVLDDPLAIRTIVRAE